MKPVAAAPVATLWLWYRVGSRHEVPGITGASHWVEHMLFKGPAAFPPVRRARRVARVGGIRNAMTWIDFTTYFHTVPADSFDLALAIEADRMVNSPFDPDEFEGERTVIISERQGAENEPPFLLDEEVRSMAFKVTATITTPSAGCATWSGSRAVTSMNTTSATTPGNAILVACGAPDVADMTARGSVLRPPAGQARTARRTQRRAGTGR